MGDQTTQQLGAIKDSLDKDYWNSANDFAREVWMSGRKLYPQEKFRDFDLGGIPQEDQDLRLKDKNLEEFLENCRQLKDRAGILMKD